MNGAAEADANGVAHPEHGGARRADSRVHVDINDPIYQVSPRAQYT